MPPDSVMPMAWTEGRAARVVFAVLGILLVTPVAIPAGQQTSANEYRTKLASLEAVLRADPGSLEKGSAYRQLAMQSRQYDRAINFLKKLAEDQDVGDAYVTLGFAYVDKIPVSGPLRQLSLGKEAIGAFGKAIGVKPSWLAYYMRGLVNLYYARMFNRVRPAIADLEQALKMQKTETKRGYHARAYRSLGDAYWKLGNLERARTVWQEGLVEFPEDSAIDARLARHGRDLQVLIDSSLDPDARVDTSLQELFAN